MVNAIAPRDGTAQGGEAPAGEEQKNAELDKVEAACKDTCKPVTTLFTDQKTKPCVSLPEDKLKEDANCRKVYCQALKDVLTCSKCQFRALGQDPESNSGASEYFKQVEEQEGAKWCKDTGVDLASA
ncbi:hypothetical protein A1Q2_00825 [Trichosporon asahii var. asahii CBS 8904]|uniref:Uncharacterized protein n=1 Tax=Trichosporon asahii var. asahii (strain CBS 8904) TaxID=1220162 RepID=K1WVJ4_TRIAC|nr:hypothetical protein A1Q2_00825 [Trichosporon asahii var. asahii CBS 8904]